ncbi:MAG: arabinose efflux permease family protein [Frankiales bacterium]|nr:arabinose efflux permease family protein [Frankiales bacterium]
MSTLTPAADGTLRSLIPARIDRLPWSPFFTRMVMALGVAWLLDGLEITIAATVIPTLTDQATLGLSSGSVGAVASVYLLGEVVGALVFGKLSDRLGRRNLFMVTLGIYLFGSGLTALTMGSSTGWVVFLYATRFLAGVGIGGEYAAINSAIDEMMPARYRGRVDIAVNGTYWAGALLATVGQLIIFDNISEGTAWRLGFLLGPILGIVILFVRKSLPESPRWLIMKGREDEAEAQIRRMEQWVRESHEEGLPPVDESKAIEIKPATDLGYRALVKVLFQQMPRRSVLGSTLMISQSFLYNAIFFTYGLVLKQFYGISNTQLPYYFIAFAIGNLAGPLLLGPLFDTLGRRKMIASTYLLSGALLAVTAVLFQAGALTALTQTLAWSAVFFFASAGASAAYLTVSEIFPIEVRAKAIAVFFAIAQGFGSLGPFVYGNLIGDGKDSARLFVGYLLGAAVMAIGGIVAWVLGVNAEGKSLEEVATPLTAVKRLVPSYPAGPSTKAPLDERIHLA